MASVLVFVLFAALAAGAIWLGRSNARLPQTVPKQTDWRVMIGMAVLIVMLIAAASGLI